MPKTILQKAGRLKVLGLLLFAVVVVVLAPTGAGAEEKPPLPSPAPVWYADGSSLIRVDPESGKASGSVDLPRGLDSVSALATDPTDSSVVVLAEGRLLGFDVLGEKTFEEALRGASALGDKIVLTKDPQDGSLWIGGRGGVVRTDPQGKDQRSVKIPGINVVQAVQPTQDGSAWVLSARRLVLVSGEGEVLSERKMPEGGVSSPTQMALDEFGGYAYLANKKEVAQVSLEEKEGETQEEPLHKVTPEGGVESLAVDPSEGTLYVANQNSLFAYDDSGKKQKTVDLKPYEAGETRAASFDASSQTVWVRGKDKLLGFSEGLEEEKANIKAKAQNKGLSVLAAKAPKLSLRLSLVQPQDGSTIADPKQPIKLKLEAVCGGTACPAKQVAKAGKKLTLSATLNGKSSVSSLFTKTGNLATGGVEWDYTPGTGLPEGKNILSAYVSSSKKSRSNQVDARFTVDTTAPRFSEVKPEDGTVITEEKATITGKVDDLKAKVYLEKLSELGGKVISDDPNGFSFEVPMKEGENSLRLLAYDEAKNMGQKSIKLIRETPLELTIAEPEQESTVSTDKITVKGSVKAPNGTTVKVGQIDASVDSEGNFVAEDVPLSEGPNEIVVKATAPGGKSTQQTLEVDYEASDTGDDPPDTEPPVDPNDSTVRSERPPNSPVPTPGPLPENPQDIAPPVDGSTTTDTAESTRFLYEGANAVQTGVEQGTIDEQRVAILKGKVLDKTGEPVPGVRITVLDHPELGQTLTRDDGQFDIAVNGGSTVTLVYEKDRYIGGLLR